MPSTAMQRLQQGGKGGILSEYLTVSRLHIQGVLYEAP